MRKWGRPGAKGRNFIARSTARINLAEGSVRSSKTVSTLMRWTEYAFCGPQGDLLMVGKTERTLKRNILDPLGEFLGPDLFQYTHGTGEATIFGRRVYLAGAADERAEGKIRGSTLAGAYGDEVTLWPESFFAMLLSRLSVSGAKFFGSTNPDGPFHWLKTGYLDRADLVRAGILRRWTFTLDDNPHLDPAFVAALKQEYVGLWYKRFILGLWVMAEGAIYDMFEESRHVRPSAGIAGQLIAAVDYGTTNPFTAGLYLVPADRRAKRAHLVRELWWDSAAQGRQKTDQQYVADVKQWLDNDRPAVIYVDPSAASFIVAARQAGLPVKAANNDVLEGIRFVSSLLGAGDFTVDPSCEHTVREFQSYAWDPKAAKRGEDAPLKAHDHAMDRNRYALYTHFKGFGGGQVATAGARVM